MRVRRAFTSPRRAYGMLNPMIAVVRRLSSVYGFTRVANSPKPGHRAQSQVHPIEGDVQSACGFQPCGQVLAVDYVALCVARMLVITVNALERVLPNPMGLQVHRIAKVIPEDSEAEYPEETKKQDL